MCASCRQRECACAPSGRCETPSYTGSALVWLDYRGQRVWVGGEEGTHGTLA